MNAPAHPYDAIAAELRKLAESEGAELWRNRIRLTGLLLDHQPELRREIRAVVAAVEQGVAHALADTERSLSAIAIDRQANLLESESGLRPEIALNVTRTIAHALNLGPLPSVYGHAAPPAPPRPVPPGPPISLDRPMPAPMPHPRPMQPPQPMPPPQHWSDPRNAQPSSTYGRGGSRFPWAVVIIGSATLAAAGIVTASVMLGGSSGNNVARAGNATAGTIPPVARNDVAASMAPGQWEYTTRIVDVSTSGASPQDDAQARTMIGNEQRHGECVVDTSTTYMAQQLAAQLSASLGQGATCDLPRQTFSNSVIDIGGTCQGPNGRIDLTANGTFTSDTSTVDLSTTAYRGAQQVMMAMRVTGRRTGACTP
jgi:hypothetical protein